MAIAPLKDSIYGGISPFEAVRIFLQSLTQRTMAQSKELHLKYVYKEEAYKWKT